MNSNEQPPQWIDALVDSLAPTKFAEEIKGDLQELFVRDTKKKNLSFAKKKYILNGLGFLVQRFFWKHKEYHSSKSIMVNGYIKMAKRSLLAYKGNTIINVLGLAIGIASALVILTLVRYELSFDRFHTYATDIYRMVRVSGTGSVINDKSELRSGISYPVPQAIKEEIAGIKNITSMQYIGGTMIEAFDRSGVVTVKFREDRGCAIVEPSFFQMFNFKGTNFKWIAGNPEKALEEPFQVVLAKTMAEKYFPAGQALGMTLRLGGRFECKVTGIIEDLPPNTDFPFSVLLSYASLRDIRGNELNDWYSVSDDHHTYILLEHSTSKAAIEKQIAAVHAAHTPKDLHESRFYLLQDFLQLHYDTRFRNYSGRTISKNTITGLCFVALFLLLTGIINYINLATAQATMRSKEIGLRKVMGSSLGSLVTQLLMETFMVVFIAGLVGLGLSEMLLFSLQSLLNIKTSGYNFSDPVILSALLGIIFMVTGFSGLYPALKISRFNPVAALKSRFSTESIGGFGLRKILVVMQFTITQVLVVITFIVILQMRYFQNKDMGFNREAIVTVTLPNGDPGKRQVIEDQLHSQSFVSDVSFSSTLPSGLMRNRSYQPIGNMQATTPNDYLVFEYEVIDPSYLDVYQIKLLAGRNLVMADSTGNILINKKLAKNLEYTMPEDAVGKEVKVGGKKVTIVGVVDDFYSNSFREPVDNIGFVINSKEYTNASIKLNTQNGGLVLPEAIKQIEKIWTAQYPEYIFEFQFFDENIKAFYAQEQKYAQLFKLFSSLFLVIGCLGLYGVITFVVNRKGKEIAIRKVLGATISNVLYMFSKEYFQLIAISFMIAVPFAYYLVNTWFNHLQEHVTLQWWLFLLPGLFVLVMAILVVGVKSIKAASANPVDKLKYD